MPRRLAICVFTHHGRHQVLAETLGSVFGQLHGLEERVEVCLTDNASHDGTEDLAREWSERYGGRFRYQRHVRNEGLVRNLLSCVALARSDYCWIVTSDDALEPGAVGRILELLDTAGEPPGVIVGKANFDRGLTTLVGQGGPYFYPPDSRRTVRYSDMGRFLGECGLLASLVSTVVVRRDAWLQALGRLGGTPVVEATIFPHLPIIAEIARSDPAWIWCPAKLVRARSDNPFLASDEGLSTEQIHLRLVRDMSAMWARHLSGDRHLRQILMRRAYGTFVTPAVLSTVAPAGRSLGRRLKLLVGYASIFWWLPEFWLRTAPFLATERFRRPPRRPRTRTLADSERAAQVCILDAPATVPNSLELETQILVENCTPVALSPAPPHPIVAGYLWLEPNGEITMQGPGLPIPKVIEPGGRLKFTMPIVTPHDPGAYELHVRLAQQDVGWFRPEPTGSERKVLIDVERFGWTDSPSAV